ncbi:MAG: RidA family protein [Planctomycetota bacterium]|nr:RidA family protein [Planctomycetota bacterium]
MRLCSPCCPYLRTFLKNVALVLVGVVSATLVGRWSSSVSPSGDAATASALAGRPAPEGAEERLRRLKIELPPVSTPVATYVPFVRVGNVLYVSGHGPGRVDGRPVVGKVGRDLEIAEGRAAARSVGIRVLGTVRHALGSLDKVVRLVKVTGMVNSTEDFKQQPQVVNGFSDLMVEVFGGEAGKGARSAVGMASLPGGIPVEIEAIFQVRD